MTQITSHCASLIKVIGMSHESIQNESKVIVQKSSKYFLACEGSKQKFNTTRLARLEKNLAQLCPGQKKWA